MKNNQFISIKHVLSDVLDTIDNKIVNVSDILEWAGKALGQMDCIEFYTRDVKILKVNDHQAYLPKGTLQVNQILYKTNYKLDHKDSEELEKILSETTNDVYKKFEYNNSIKNNFFNNWLPLRASTNNFMLSVLCSNSPNLLMKCNEEFDILPTGKIITSFKEGYIIISYYKSSLNEEEDYLIPNDDELVEALRYYTLYRLWEKRWNMKEDGASERIMYYKQLWGIYKNMVRGKMKLLSEDQYQNILEYSLSLLPKNKRYYNYFGTLGSSDKTFF